MLLLLWLSFVDVSVVVTDVVAAVVVVVDVSVVAY